MSVVAAPSLPRERVGPGAALALLAIPAGALVTGLAWRLGLVGAVGGVVTAPLAALLYARGSSGRVARAVPVVIGVAVVGIVVCFWTIVAVDLWASYGQLDPSMASVFGSRWAYLADNLLYPTLLERYPRSALFVVVAGVLGGVFAVLRLRRLQHQAEA